MNKKFEQTALFFRTDHLVVVGICLSIFLCGCSRQTYRKWADRDAYRLLRSRQSDSAWVLPSRTVAANPKSRMADHSNPDCGPLPPDDPAASCYMIKPYHSKKQVSYWNRKGELSSINSDYWMQFLPYNESGEVELDKQISVDLALLNNREYQSLFEQLYSQALTLSQNRFEFDLNWFGGSDTLFEASGDGADANRNLQTSNQLGFTRNLATGGQFATNLLNSFTWQLGGSGNSNFGTGNLLFSLTQPLLRGAFRYVRTESLTQAERNLLYGVRDFARFRRQFYFTVVSQYLGLLNRVAAVAINEDNLRNLKFSLEEHEVLFERELVSPIQVDQVYQRYQTGRIDLINSQQSLQTALDQFKFQLGLPAKVSTILEDSILRPFELNSPEVESLQEAIEELEDAMITYLPPEIAPPEFLIDAYSKVKSLAGQLEKLKPQVDAEFEKWSEKIEASKPAEDAVEAEKIDYDQQVSLAKRVKEFLDELDVQIAAANKLYEKDVADLDILIERPRPADQQVDPAIQAWQKIQRLIARPEGLSDRLNTLFVAQTQIRLFLIEISPLEIEQEKAVNIALRNRLDLMNSRAAVVDAYRQVEVAADQLQSDLDVSASADLRTDPTRDNAFRFDGDENQYNVGVEFDGPLNRLSERNGYRNAQLAYQQQRRAYMAAEDSIVNSVRLNLRQLQTNRFSFQIARQQLIAATRQVEQAQVALRSATSGDSSLTQDLLIALQSLRDNKNGLISNWIDYEISRIALFVDLELLRLNDQGIWINERENFDNFDLDGCPLGSNVAEVGPENIDSPDAAVPEYIPPDDVIEQPADRIDGPPAQPPALDAPIDDRSTDRRRSLSELLFRR